LLTTSWYLYTHLYFSHQFILKPFFLLC
jgi:hypothetical protein